MTDGKEDYVISNNDIIDTDLLNPRGGGLGSDDEADDLLTPRGKEACRGKIYHMQKQRKSGKSFKHHLQPCCHGKMLLSHLEICFQGTVRSFSDISSFMEWENSMKGSSKVIGIRGVAATNGHGDPLLSHFVTLTLNLPPPPCWRHRRIGFLQKRCGHRFAKEGAVMRREEIAHEEAASIRRIILGIGDVIMQDAPPAAVTFEVGQEAPPTSVTSEAEQANPPFLMTSEAKGYKRGLQGQNSRLCPSPELTTNLSFFTLQYLPALSPLSAQDGSATQLSWLEREAVRMRGRPWELPGGDRRHPQKYYPIWITWQHMTDERKGLVI